MEGEGTGHRAGVGHGVGGAIPEEQSAGPAEQRQWQLPLRTGFGDYRL